MEGAVRCDLCSEEFDSLDKLNVHIDRKHKTVRESKKKNFQCNLCGLKFSNGKDLIRHMRTHTGERPFKCQASGCGCGVAFAQKSTLTNHIKFKHSDERPFKCDFPGCLHTDKILANLTTHKKVHSDKRPFSCPNSGCSYRAKSSSLITRHLKCVHSEAKPFACSQCDYKTALNNHLIRHKRLHSSKRDFKCSHLQCGASFRDPSHLKRHCRDLHGEKNIQCDRPGCGQHVTTKAALKDHLKLHNPSGRVLQCPLCFKHFKTLQHLQDHYVVHTNEKPFQCGHCKYEAATRTHVKTHISSTHTDIKFPFIVHLLDDRECLHCKMTLPTAEFVVHCKDQHHVDPIVIN